MIKEVDLKKQSLLMGTGSARDIFDKWRYLDFNVIENPSVPAGQYYLVDKADKNWYQGKYDYRNEVSLELDQQRWRQENMQQMITLVNTHIDEKVLYNAMGMSPGEFASYTMPENACDACHGSGKFNGEECWHCLGEGDDPTK